MTTQHTKLPWVFFVSANNTVISPKWGQFKLAALDSDNHKIDAQFIVTACNWHDEAREALTEIALLCEQDNDKTDWQDILRRANSALEHLQSAQAKE